MDRSDWQEVMSPRGQIIIWLLNGTNESSCQPFSSVWALSPSTEQMSGHYLKRSSAWVNFWSAEWAVILEISFLGYHVGRQGESQLLWETIPLNTALDVCLKDTAALEICSLAAPGSNSGAANVELINGRGIKLLLKYSGVWWRFSHARRKLRASAEI